MRWICKADIEESLTEEWRNNADAALKELENASTPQDRKSKIDSAASGKIWRDFYDLLPDDLKKKCWYCEAEEIRSDMPVDHFRPKKKITEDDSHPGYWWLTYDWKNYRCACTYCNSRRVFENSEGGKQNSFPLIDPSKRASRPEDLLDLEEPAFLDPLDCDDYKLLWFDNDGFPIINPNRISTTAQLKVDNSISIFHLHEGKLVKNRNRIRIKINNIVRELKQAKKVGNLRVVKTKKEELTKMIRPSEMLSLTALVYLKQHKHIDEVKDILNPE